MLQLASASTMLIIIFSTMLYHYIKIEIYENVVQNLNLKARKIANMDFLDIENLKLYREEAGSNSVEIAISNNDENLLRPRYIKTMLGDEYFLILEYPAKDRLITLKTETTFYNKIISQILIDILIINATMILLILFYALFLSRSLLMPIKTLSNKLSKLNETVLSHIDESSIPDEFLPLGKGINRLIDRIHTFIKYQKELFIGVAHELKTPLAVMKTKNEVTLLKQRESEKYIEALQNNISSIDTMNKMISSILEIGRQEGAQFEEGVKKDMIAYLKELGTNFKILARGKNKDIELSLSPNVLFMTVQPTLFMHIIQNFVQNAIKFSPENAVVTIQSKIENKFFVIEVLDEGDGIDENIDLFAPFKRYGNESGAGLGLFLAKGAAQAMNAEISLKNREDKKGTIATIKLPLPKKVKKLS
ncbi:sensor histidine kinase [Campylobacter geochelonis]|nr:HAMP domain-containing sensor histidine kinase [Campylobacter geochelonis]